MTTVNEDTTTSTPPGTDADPDSPRPPLGRRFLTVWAGQTASATGSVVSGVGVAVYIFLETGSAAWLGLLTALAAVPYVLVAPFLGIVDRLPRKQVMMAADAVAASGWLAVLALAIGDRLQPWHLVAAAFIGGVGTAFQFPASQAAIPSLVTPSALDRANGLSQLGPAIGVVLGPVLATPLVAHWGIEAVIVLDLATFVIGLATVAVVKFDERWADDAEPDTSWAPVLHFLRTEGRPLVTLMLTIGIVNLCLAFFNVSLITGAIEVAGAARAGLPMTVAGGAMIAGSIAVGVVGVSSRRIRTLVLGLGLVALGCIVAAARPSIVLIMMGAGLALVAAPAVNASISTIFHERTPANLQGRVFGVRAGIGRALEPVGSVLAGLVIARIAVPAVEPGTRTAEVLSPLIGEGTGRGPALVLLGTGVVLLGLVARLRWSSLASVIDVPADTEAPLPDDASPVRETQELELATS